MAASLPPENPQVRMAGERTLLAWVRTGLAMMGFGFVVARFGLFLHELEGIDPKVSGRSIRFSVLIGVSLVLLGVAVNVLAAGQHRYFLHAIKRGEDYRPDWSLSIIVALLLALVGLVMAIYLIVFPH